MHRAELETCQLSQLSIFVWRPAATFVVEIILLLGFPIIVLDATGERFTAAFAPLAIGLALTLTRCLAKPSGLAERTSIKLPA